MNNRYDDDRSIVASFRELANSSSSSASEIYEKARRAKRAHIRALISQQRQSSVVVPPTASSSSTSTSECRINKFFSSTTIVFLEAQKATTCGESTSDADSCYSSLTTNGYQHLPRTQSLSASVVDSSGAHSPIVGRVVDVAVAPSTRPLRPNHSVDDLQLLPDSTRARAASLGPRPMAR